MGLMKDPDMPLDLDTLQRPTAHELFREFEGIMAGLRPKEGQTPAEHLEAIRKAEKDFAAFQEKVSELGPYASEVLHDYVRTEWSKFTGGDLEKSYRLGRFAQMLGNSNQPSAEIMLAKVRHMRAIQVSDGPGARGIYAELRRDIANLGAMDSARLRSYVEHDLMPQAVIAGAGSEARMLERMLTRGMPAPELPPSAGEIYKSFSQARTLAASPDPEKRELGQKMLGELKELRGRHSDYFAGEVAR